MPRHRKPDQLAVLAAGLLLAPLAAQARSTVLVGPPALGATCYVQHVLPAGSVGHVAGFLWSGPFAGAVAVPGLAVNGLLRVEPATYVALGVGATDGVNAPSMAVAVPSSPTLLGSQLDAQSFDLDLAGVFQLAGNDVQLTVVSGPSAVLDMVAIAPGTFWMGSPEPVNQPPHWNQSVSTPVHPVAIPRPFWIGRYEVTQAQYLAQMGSNPSYFPGLQRPVEQVTWLEAVGYCQSLTASEAAAGRVPAGYTYRLPTEAEWEYCCRAGTTTEFALPHTVYQSPWGPYANLACGQANTSNWDAQGIWYPCVNGTAVVGSYTANAWGLHDMHGNVWELTLDSWDGSANYPATAVMDPFVGSGPLRILRGGVWDYICRSASRYGVPPTYSDAGLGFRVVLAPVLP